MKKLLVIPDVHGSSFWKESCADITGYEKVIFLGDYLDSSVFEAVTPEAMLENLREIINFKKEHPDKVVLLLGNHDFGYLHHEHLASRSNPSIIVPVREILSENRELFQIAHLQNKKLLFTHAGITESWYQRHKDLLDKFSGTIDQTLNNCFTEQYSVFAEVSIYRGGQDNSGSPIWADIHETAKGDCLPGFIHIVGHTPVENQSYVELENGAIIFCDCHKPYMMEY